MNIENIENIEKLSDTKTLKKYDNKKHFKKFIEINKDKLNDPTICNICLGNYKYFSKSKHIKTKKHIAFLGFKERNPLIMF
jgi:hypothetical protein